MYRAYIITTSYTRAPDRKKEIAKGQTLAECQQAMRATNWWKYLMYLLGPRKLTAFEEYIYITKTNGDRVWDTQKIDTINEFLKKFQDEDFTKIGDVANKIVEDIVNGI